MARFVLHTWMVAPADDAHHGNFCGLQHGQPLLLWEAGATTIAITDLYAVPCGTLCPEHTALVLERMKQDSMLLAHAYGHCWCVGRAVMLRSDGQVELQHKHMPLRNVRRGRYARPLTEACREYGADDLPVGPK